MLTDIETQLQEEELVGVATGENGEIAVLMTIELGNYVYGNKLGRMFDRRTTFEMQPGSPKKEPDISFVAAGRLPTRVRDIVKLAPDLVIEIVSPNDKLFEVEEKTFEYLSLGVRLVWIVSPASKVIYVYHPGDLKPTTLGMTDELDGEGVVPGFKLAVSKLFEEK